MRFRWQHPTLLGMILLVGACVVGVNAAAQAPPPAAPAWKLVWSDEFNGPNGSAVDSNKWVTETGGGGWGNNELEYYTSRACVVGVNAAAQAPPPAAPAWKLVWSDRW